MFVSDGLHALTSPILLDLDELSVKFVIEIGIRETFFD